MSPSFIPTPNTWASTVLLLVWLAARPALADELRPTDLPPTATVRQHILNRPEVRAATALQQADQADADRIKAGPYEFTLRLAAQQRRTTENQRYFESQMALERTVRNWGKAAQDEAIGDASNNLAQIRKADAIHESSRALLRAWMDWLRERETVKLWQSQVADQTAVTRHAARRVKAGDAAQVELRLQEASQAQASANLSTAQTREAAARSLLDTQYPGLSAQAPVNLSMPWQADLPVGVETSTVPAQLAERSHEARMANATVQLTKARAERIRLDQTIDPTVGVYFASDKSGAERVMGLSISVPLASQARTATTRQALALATEAEQRSEATAQKIRTESTQAWLTAQSVFTAWQSQEQARQKHEQVLQSIVKGWQLGEYSQSDILLARRQYLDAALAEINARAEARHAAARLKLDLHEMWEFDDE